MAETLLVEFGMGSSLRRGDYTQAAERAVRNCSALIKARCGSRWMSGCNSRIVWMSRC